MEQAGADSHGVSDPGHRGAGVLADRCRSLAGQFDILENGLESFLSEAAVLFPAPTLLQGLHDVVR